MNKKYWEEFYKKKYTLKPTDFAKFCIEFIPDKSKIIIDLGCGNGRDSYFFDKKGYIVVGIDYANLPKDTINIDFFNYSLEHIIAYFPFDSNDVIYSRFFISSITDEEIDKLLKKVKGYFMAEFRSKGDKPVNIYKKHKRNFIDGNKFISKLISNGFDILYYKKGYNLAKFKNENPLMIRVIAKKNKK
jgi:SAM-dependent methyltransferase